MKLRALIVEDCGVVRTMLKQLLPLTGLAEFEFAEARDGAEALARFRPEDFDILFLDWNLPRVNGLEFARAVRARRESDHIPIVMVTGQISRRQVEEATERVGVDVYITKPFRLEDLNDNLAPLIASLPQAHAERGGRPFRILVVEDNHDVRESLSMVLSVAGYQVEGAANGREALDHLRKSPAPDVILLDLTMPVMDGWEFRAHQRRDDRLAQIPVVVMSGFVDHRTVMEQSLGTAFLSKPISGDRLRHTIAHLQP